MKVLITGAAGQLARAVLPRLCLDSKVTRLVALDRRPLRLAHPKIETSCLDLRTAALEPILQDCDALVHLAWTVIRGRTSANSMYANNVMASQRLFQAAGAAGVKRLIHVSSAAVYGNGTLLAEDAALAPLAGFLYARHKAEFETWLTREFPAATVLRPHIILGPNALPLLKAMLARPFYVKLSDPQPLLQCVHEEDVARAIELSLHSHQAGPFNLAAADTFSYRDAVGQRHARAFGVPYAGTRLMFNGAWRIFGIGAEPGWLAGMRGDLTLDCGKAVELLGWQPRYGSLETLQHTPEH